jgi:sugar phosphate isomerase/epimerase
MQVALEYGVLHGDVEAQIAFLGSINVAHVILGSWAIPGYGDVGYLSPEMVERIKGPLDRAGISIDGFWFGDNSISLMLDPGGAGGVLARLGRSLQTMEEFGIRLAPVMNVVRAENGEAREQLWGRMIELYRRLVAEAEANGVTLVTHTHWTSDHLVWNTETLLQLLQEVRSDCNKAIMCAGSLWSAGDRMAESVERLGDRIGMVHFRDSRERSGGCEEMPLGSGLTEFRGVVAALDRLGYDGLIRPEHVGRVAGERDGTASMAMAVGFIRGIMHGLGVREG